MSTSRASAQGSAGLVLGTAQFGGRYGIVNRSGCPDDNELATILATARAGGIRYLDTARAYGSAEERLGQLIGSARGFWQIITKIAPLDELMRAEAIRDASAAVELSIARSLAALGTAQVEVAMFHRASDLFAGGALDALRRERDRGAVREIGVSLYTPDEASRALDCEDIRHIQLPFNFLDSRWRVPTVRARFDRRPDVVVHARSAFLQGLLLSPASAWPAWVEEADDIVAGIEDAAAELGVNRLALCLRYVQSQAWIATAVVGVDTADQLGEILQLELATPLPSGIEARLDELADRIPSRLLNPALW